MYYPYLRGRQNELFCIRGLLESGRLGPDITPIIEPVKFTTTLFDTLDKFLEKGHDIAFIYNPKVGSFWDEYSKNDSVNKYKKFEPILENGKITKAFLNERRIVDGVKSGRINAEDCFIINTKNGDYNLYEDTEFSSIGAKMTFIPKDEDFKDIVTGNTAILEDHFEREARNKDYLLEEDQLFSRDHLVYRKHGYRGFGDYTIVGDEYEESGFAPAAIAIHIVYFDEKEQLRIHHFVSDTNESITDPARKFYEAMEKIVEWSDKGKLQHTLGLSTLLNYYYQGKFPGLGLIKRCAIMHHLELIGTYEERTNDLL